MSKGKVKISAKDQWNKIQKIANKEVELNPDKLYYIISMKWFSQWKDFVNGGSRPGAIDNSDIISDETIKSNSPQLKMNLQENIDYNILSSEEWHKLHKWCALSIVFFFLDD